MIVKRSEHTEQVAIIAWARALAPQVPPLHLLYHIPNGYARSKASAGKVKAAGGVAGIPDLALPVARKEYHGLYLELKYGKGAATAHQQELLAALTHEGYCTVLVWGAKYAIACLEWYLGLRVNLTALPISLDPSFDFVSLAIGVPSRGHSRSAHLAALPGTSPSDHPAPRRLRRHSE